MIIFHLPLKNLQCTLSSFSSFSAVCGMGRLSARQVSILPLSSRSGTKVIVEMVALPSSFTLSRTLLLSRSGPSHQEICAEGREPMLRHWNSALLPAANTIAGDEWPEEEETEEKGVTFDEDIVGVDLVSIFTSSGRTAWEKKRKNVRKVSNIKAIRGTQYFFIRLQWAR